MKKMLGLLFAFMISDFALACKPCSPDSLGYALYNNDFVLIGKAVKIGNAPANVISRNAKINNMWKEEGYSVPVMIEVEEVIAADSERKAIKKGDLFETHSSYSPPCKGLVLPKVGARSIFFPKDYGNCSRFVYEATGDRFADRTLEDIRALSAKRSH